MQALAANIVHFARGLRRAGLPIGSGQVLDALRAAQCIDLAQREDFYWSLASVLIDRHAHLELFDLAFKYFWEQRPLMRTTTGAGQAQDSEQEWSEVAQRVQQAFAQARPPSDAPKDDNALSADASFTTSAREALGQADFQSLSVEQVRAVKRMLARLRLPIEPVKMRRTRPHLHGDRIDLRATLRQALRDQGEPLQLCKRAPRRQQPPLVVLCDISGSMQRYSEMLLHFLHALSNHQDRVHVFLFGTRLTNITRQLRHRDVDAALAAVAKSVADWSGGTRIGASLAHFNRLWSRRVLGQNAVVLLISDGLEREGIEQLSQAMERLHKSCRQLIWLNPLLRYQGFEPLAGGVRAMLPHVDDFRPVHNIASLMDLAQALSSQKRNLTAWK